MINDRIQHFIFNNSNANQFYKINNITWIIKQNLSTNLTNKTKNYDSNISHKMKYNSSNFVYT